jgi:hypothetical protein
MPDQPKQPDLKEKGPADTIKEPPPAHASLFSDIDGKPHIAGCQMVFSYHNPGYVLDYTFAASVWAMHVGSLRTVVKFFVLSPISTFAKLWWFVREFKFTRMFGQDTAAGRKLGEQLLGVHAYAIDGKEIDITSEYTGSEEAMTNLFKSRLSIVYGAMIMERIDGILEHIWPLLDAENRTRLTTEVDTLVGNLHGRDYVHGDLHRGNIGYRLVQSEGGPTVHAILIDWGRCFHIGDDTAASGVSRLYTPYDKVVGAPLVTESNVRTLELAYWKSKSSEVAYSMSAWVNNPHTRLDGSLVTNNAPQSAAVAYWFRQLFGWPIYGVFPGKDAIYYYAAVPTQPVRFMDTYGIETTAAVRERFANSGNPSISIAPVDDTFSNVSLFNTMVVNWKSLMSVFRDVAISSAKYLNTTFLNVHMRDPQAIDLSTRGFVIGKKASAKKASSTSSSSSSSSSSSDSSGSD